MARKMVPITDLSGSLQEHGRIRLGMVRNGRPTSIDTFRFTSPDREAIETIAGLYGGTARPWDEKKATVRNQWEVVTDAKEIEIWVGADSLSQSYELWTAAGCQRRCDGIEVTALHKGQMVTGPCICNAEEDNACTPKTRLSVVIPEVRMAGAWRVETSSWAAAREMPQMMALLGTVQATGLNVGRLRIAEGMSKSGGQTKRFTYPQLIIDVSARALMSGEAAVKAITSSSATPPPAGELPMVSMDEDLGVRDEWGHRDSADGSLVEDDVIDAEVIDEAQVWPTKREAGMANPGRKIIKVGSGWGVEGG